MSWNPDKQFKSGNVPWNKGLKMGAQNKLWKGDNVGYAGLHAWVRRHLGKAFWCTWCFSCVNVQWANISHQYKRDLSDYLQLCGKCHAKYDDLLNKRTFACRDRLSEIAKKGWDTRRRQTV